MIKKAASLWGVAPNEIEMSFDPIVSLLISACASEIEKISGDINESQMRVTEKLIQLMTPETVYGPKPAHAILYTEPSAKTVTIKPEYLFYFKKKVTFKNTSVKFKNLYFSPSQDFKLVDAKITHLATGNMISTINAQKQTELLYRDTKKTVLPNATLYLGITSPITDLPMEDVSIYFELRDVEDRDLFYHHLRNTIWVAGENTLDKVPGFHSKNEERRLDLNAIFEDISNKTNNICQQTNNNYKKHYVTLKANKDASVPTETSYAELDSWIQEKKIKIDEKVRWIKVVFPTIIDNTSLENVFCSLNTFPAINRELNEFSYQMKQYIHIVPVKTEDLFLDMKSIVNTDGKKYKTRSKNNLSEEKGSFVVRDNNIGKLDHRKAREYLVNLIELLKDESASFSFFNNDFLQSNLKGLNQLISLLEKKVSETSTQLTETNYVVLKPYKKKEHLLLEYWTTNGSLANGIKSGSPLEIYKGMDIKQKSSVMITPTYGGKDELSMEERLHSYRRSILSRDRVVTKEDVKALCYEMYGDKITSVQVQKAFTKSIGLTKGMIQCIEILLLPNKDNSTTAEEWESIHTNLMFYLENNSINVFPYKIKILN